MATLTPSTTLGLAQLNSINTLLNAGGAGYPAKNEIFAGAKPTRPDVAITTQVLLGTQICSDIAGVVGLIDGVPTLTFNAITADAAADASGTATWGRLSSTGTGAAAVLDYDISTTGGSGFGKMNTTNIVAGGPITAPSIVITA